MLKTVLFVTACVLTGCKTTPGSNKEQIIPQTSVDSWTSTIELSFKSYLIDIDKEKQSSSDLDKLLTEAAHAYIEDDRNHWENYFSSQATLDSLREVRKTALKPKAELTDTQTMVGLTTTGAIVLGAALSVAIKTAHTGFFLDTKRVYFATESGHYYVNTSEGLRVVVLKKAKWQYAMLSNKPLYLDQNSRRIQSLDYPNRYIDYDPERQAFAFVEYESGKYLEKMPLTNENVPIVPAQGDRPAYRTEIYTDTYGNPKAFKLLFPNDFIHSDDVREKRGIFYAKEGQRIYLHKNLKAGTMAPLQSPELATQKDKKISRYLLVDSFGNPFVAIKGNNNAGLFAVIEADGTVKISATKLLELNFGYPFNLVESPEGKKTVYLFSDARTEIPSVLPKDKWAGLLLHEDGRVKLDASGPYVWTLDEQAEATRYYFNEKLELIRDGNGRLVTGRLTDGLSVALSAGSTSGSLSRDLKFVPMVPSLKKIRTRSMLESRPKTFATAAFGVVLGSGLIGGGAAAALQSGEASVKASAASRLLIALGKEAAARI